MPHYPGHLIIGVAAFAATLLISTLTPNRLVRRKLTLSLFLLGCYILLHPVLLARPDLSTAGSEIDQQIRAIEHLLLAAAIINIFVLALLNPLTSIAYRITSPRSSRTRSSSACSSSSRLLFQGQAADDVGRRRGGGRVRAAGDARQRLRRPGDSDREAVQGRRVDSRRRVRGTRDRDHLARDQAAHEVGQLRDPAEQHHGARGDHQLLRAARPDPARGRRRRQLLDAAQRGQGRHPRRADAGIECVDAAPARRAPPQLRRVLDRLPGAVLGRGLRARRADPRPGAHRDLLRVRPAQHRDPVSDSG